MNQQLLFLAHVNKASGRKIRDLSECWIYSGSVNKDGYGRFQTNWAVENGVTYAHQASYKLFKDSEYKPCREHPCSHLCESPTDINHRRCVNPDHLYIANSIADNIADRDSNRGSYQSVKTKGSKNGMSKFSVEQVEEIKTKRASGKTYKEIAEEYGVNRRTIERVCLGRTY